MRLIGDIHGNLQAYHEICRRTNGDTIQVGDFGIGFDKTGKFINDQETFYQETGRRHRFIRGNHDCLEMCKTMKSYIQDGSVFGDKMFVGGASSIDVHSRTEGVDWWRDEELSYNEWYDIIDRYEDVKPRIMVTHDCPFFLYDEMLQSNKSQALPSITAKTFEIMLEIHAPKLWVFGHHHKTRVYDKNGCKFICLGIMDFIDIEIW